MKENAITLTTLASRLEKAIHKDVGMQGLRILLYGWKMKYHLINDHTFSNRQKDDGEAYLTRHEALHFSQYAGYDLTRE